MNKINNLRLATFGAKPVITLTEVKYYKQTPDFKSVKRHFSGLFESRWYTNQGPLTNTLENQLSGALNTKHAICMTNYSIALAICILAFGKRGEVIVPNGVSNHVLSAITMAGCTPIKVDSDAKTLSINVNYVSNFISNNTVAIWGLNITGSDQYFDKIKHSENIFTIVDESITLSFQTPLKYLSNKKVVSISTFNQPSLLNASDGAFLCTNDDALAAKLRNIRSSYGAGTQVSIPFTGNGRLSEAQALLVLNAINNFDVRCNIRKSIYEKVISYLLNIPGIEVQLYSNDQNFNNYQNLIFSFDSIKFGLSWLTFSNIMQKENVSLNSICSTKGDVTIVSFPINELIHVQKYVEIFDLFRYIQGNAQIIEQELKFL